MLDTIRYAKSIYYDNKRDWNKIVERAMTVDYSWSVSAKKYEALYDGLTANAAEEAEVAEEAAVEA